MELRPGAFRRPVDTERAHARRAGTTTLWRFGERINLIGTVHDAHARGSGTPWTCEGLRLGIQTHGTINDPSDRDQGWSMELAIPFVALDALSGAAPRPGDVWRFHVARYDHSVFLPGGEELSSCARLRRRNFHYTEDWIALRFEGPTAEPSPEHRSTP